MNGVAIAFLVICCLLAVAWQQRRQLRSSGRSNSSQILRPQQRQLERKLLKLLGGDSNTANRLIQQSRLKHPDKSLDWHWEKVIYDLERDRWR